MVASQYQKYADDLSWMWWRTPPTTLPVSVQPQTNGGTTAQDLRDRTAAGDLSWMWWRTPPTTPQAKGLLGWKKFLNPGQFKNPLADKANWETGGRKAAGNGNGEGGNMMWMYAGGALLVAVLLMRRKK